MYLKLQFGGSPTYLCTIKPEMSNTTIYKDIKTKNKKKKLLCLQCFMIVVLVMHG